MKCYKVYIVIKKYMIHISETDISVIAVSRPIKKDLREWDGLRKDFNFSKY